MQLLYSVWALLPIIIFISQVIFVIHVLKTDRNRYWVYLIIFLPPLGSIIYFVMVIIPELFLLIFKQDLEIFFSNLFVKKKSIKDLKSELDLSGSVQSKEKLADAYFKKNEYLQAIKLYEDCLSGFYSDDTDIIIKLARTYYLSKDYVKALTMLKKLLELDESMDAETLLLYAKTLEKNQLIEEALKTYQQVIHDHYGLEGDYRYLILLEKVKDKLAFDKERHEVESKYKFMIKKYQHEQTPWYKKIVSKWPI